MNVEELKTLIKEKFVAVSSQFSKGQLLVVVLLIFLLALGGMYLNFQRQPAVIKESADSLKTKKNLRREETMKVIVHVAGAVRNPGVYELKEGSRVVDAIKVAGGEIDGAELNALNLAAKVSDGEKIYVPRKGETNVAQAGLFLSGNTSDLVNINTASVEELDKLPGIGDTLAQRIVEYRTSHGGFKKIEELREVEGIGPKKFEQIKTKVTL